MPGTAYGFLRSILAEHGRLGAGVLIAERKLCTGN